MLGRPVARAFKPPGGENTRQVPQDDLISAPKRTTSDYLILPELPRVYPGLPEQIRVYSSQSG